MSSSDSDTGITIKTKPLISWAILAIFYIGMGKSSYSHFSHVGKGKRNKVGQILKKED